MKSSSTKSRFSENKILKFRNMQMQPMGWRRRLRRDSAHPREPLRLAGRCDGRVTIISSTPAGTRQADAGDAELPNGEIEVVGNVHDALVAFIDEDKVQTLVPQVVDIISNLPLHQLDWKPQLQLTVDAEVGPNGGPGWDRVPKCP
jgi:hypothetical protein